VSSVGVTAISDSKNSLSSSLRFSSNIAKSTDDFAKGAARHPKTSRPGGRSQRFRRARSRKPNCAAFPRKKQHTVSARAAHRRTFEAACTWTRWNSTKRLCSRPFAASCSRSSCCPKTARQYEYSLLRRSNSPTHRSPTCSAWYSIRWVSRAAISTSKMASCSSIAC